MSDMETHELDADLRMLIARVSDLFDPSDAERARVFARVARELERSQHTLAKCARLNAQVPRR